MIIIPTPQHPHIFKRYKDAVNDFVLNAGPHQVSFIVFSLKTRQFFRFDGENKTTCVANYCKYIGDEFAGDIMPDFQEVIDETSWHALVFDLDLDVENPNRNLSIYNSQVATFRESIREIIRIAIDVYFDMFNDVISERDFVICESLHNEEMHRLSAHVLIKRAVPHYMIASHFVTTVIGSLSAEESAIIDRSIYSKRHNLRLVGCAKVGSKRVKIMPQNCEFIDTIVGSPLLQRIPSEKATQWLEILQSRTHTASNANMRAYPSAIVDKAIALVDAKYGINAHKFRQQVGSLLIFTRIAPTFCILCKRNHDNDNTLILRVNMCDDDVRVVELCRRYNEEHKDSIGSASSYIDFGYVIEQQEISDILTYVRTTVSSVDSRSWEARIRRESYNEPVMHNYPFNVRTLFVNAPMKIGKTKALHRYMTTNMSDENAKIIIVSFRRTFSSAVAARFPDFELYRNISGDLCASRLIVQVESLHRMVPDKIGPVDLLVLDESESIIEQFNSGLSASHTGDFAVFQWLLRTAHRCIAMDAFMTERTYAVIGRMRGVANALCIRNEYKNAINDNYYLTSNKNIWLLSLKECVKKGERIVVCVNSATEGRAVRGLIMQQLHDSGEDLRVKFYSAETSATVKNRDFEDVAASWSDCDILIYTPTLTAGVSFETEHFDTMFGYFTDKSCSAQVCIQMMGRIRNISRKKFFICIKSESSLLPETRAEMILSMRIKKNAIMLGNEMIDIEYTEEGLPTIPDTDYAELCVQNAIMRNKSRNNFTFEFARLIAMSGPHTIELTGRVFNNLFAYFPSWNDLELIKNERKNIGEEISYARALAIVESPELSGDEYKVISDKMCTGYVDIPNIDRFAAQKFELRQVYNYHGKLSPEFVETYYDPMIMRAYRNLHLLCECMERTNANIVAALAEIGRVESEYLRELANTRDDSEGIRELCYSSSYETHRLAYIVTNVMGFVSVFDKRVYTWRDVEENIMNNSARIRRIFPSLRAQFKISRSIANHARKNAKITCEDIMDPNIFAKVASEIIRETYCIELVIVQDMCQLSPPSAFIIQPNYKVIPRIVVD